MKNGFAIPHRVHQLIFGSPPCNALHQSLFDDSHVIRIPLLPAQSAETEAQIVKNAFDSESR